MIKITAIVVIGVLLIVILKQVRPEYAFLTRIAIICTAVVAAMAGVSLALDNVSIFASFSQLDAQYIKILTKVVGVSVITQTAGNICRDCGETALAGIAELTGKIVILGIVFPVVEKLFELSVELIS